MSKPARTTSGREVPPRDFESALAELESLVVRLEQGDMSLESSLDAYRRGMTLAAFCRKTLEGAEQQVRLLEEGVWLEHQVDGGEAAEP